VPLCLSSLGGLARVVPTLCSSGSRDLEVTYVAGRRGGWPTHFFMPDYDSLHVSY